MVSKFGHCLNDLLFRARIGALPVEIAAVVSNHTDFAELVASYDVPFHHIPVTRDTKAEAEAQLLELVRAEDVELVVLARYMQVLSDDLCKQLSGRIINIHHSFLPSFKGAKPYHQAHARGVKLIGATAHYVTADLDEGPIIEQEVERVGHERDAGPARRHRARRGVPGAGPRGEVARGAPDPAQRPPHGRLRRSAPAASRAGRTRCVAEVRGSEPADRDAAANRTSRIASRSPSWPAAASAGRHMARGQLAELDAVQRHMRDRVVGRAERGRGVQRRCTSRRRPCPRSPDAASGPAHPAVTRRRAGAASPARRRPARAAGQQPRGQVDHPVEMARRDGASYG